MVEDGVRELANGLHGVPPRCRLGEEVSDALLAEVLATFARYAVEADRALAEQADAALLSGQARFPAPPG